MTYRLLLFVYSRNEGNEWLLVQIDKEYTSQKICALQYCVFFLLYVS